MEQKYKIGDRVRIRSFDWYNANKDETNDIDCGNVVFLKSMQRFCGRIVTIIDVNEVQNIYTTVLKKDYLSIENHAAEVMQLNGEMIEGLVEEENNDCEKCGLTRNSTRCLFMDNCPHNKQKNIIEIPKDYVIKDENDNVINATKIVLEKKKEEVTYPKTIEECCAILGLEFNPFYTGVKRQINYKDGLLHNLKCLLIYRDAYWKLYGEEMGLDGPWEPDWRKERYIIYRNQYDIIGGYRGAGCAEHHIFEFPTPVMRDVFEDNFGPDLEICKEFL